MKILGFVQSVVNGTYALSKTMITRMALAEEISVFLVMRHSAWLNLNGLRLIGITSLIGVFSTGFILQNPCLL